MKPGYECIKKRETKQNKIKIRHYMAYNGVMRRITPYLYVLKEIRMHYNRKLDNKHKKFNSKAVYKE